MNPDANLPNRPQLVLEFAKAALQGSLSDPACNPATQERIDEVCDFCWRIAKTMVERMPPFTESIQ